MSINTIIDNLKKRIDSFESKAEATEIGHVVELHDGIAKVSGLTGCEASEILEFPGGVFGIALNLEEDAVGAILVGSYTTIKEGDVVKRTKQILSIPVGNGIVGRVVDPLGKALDGKGEIKEEKRQLIEKKAPGVMERQPVDQPVQTGIKSIDAMIPIGRGQRELIIGDRQTGKTAVALDTIINQKGKNIMCVYVAIGQKKSKVARVIDTLTAAGAMAYTTIVLAGVSDGAPMSYLAPYSGAAIGEFFMDQGKDVLIVFDDLSKHAVAYREISLLLRRPPGREAYPGDVFYLHSRLLERAARRNVESGGGSMTALPIIETQAGDISAYIPTNVISITDGQIFLETGLFYKGVRPAVNVGTSVSRVGGAAQIKSMKKVAGRIKLDLAQYRELESFAQFASDLDAETKKVLERGQRAVELLKQPAFSPVRVGTQVALMFALNNGFLDGMPINDIAVWQKDFSKHLESVHVALVERIEKDWDDAIQADLKKVVADFGAGR